MRHISPIVCLTIFSSFVASSLDDDEGRAVLLLEKKLFPDQDITVGKRLNVTLTVFNKGPGNAYSLVVGDDNWKQDKFLVVSGANNFTLDFLNAGDSYEHQFTVMPIKKTWLRVRAAKMAFIDGVEGENTIMHMSNTLPDMRIGVKKDNIEDMLLFVGRILTLNNVKTKTGWMYVGGFLVLLLMLQLYQVAKSVIRKRRYVRTLEEVKKF